MSHTENRKRKYCLICHIFKPERCHHCSKCGRCVLGMDHHCPWLFSCIGYYNRRYFMHTLFWSNFTLLTILMADFSTLLQIGQFYINLNSYDSFFNRADYIIFCITYALTIFLLITLFKFTLFHYRIILKNNTTLEILDSERKKADPI